MPLGSADIIGGFQRLKEAGAGAQATVWKAKCVADVQGIVPPGTVVALKIRNVHAAEAAGEFEKLRRRIDDLRRMGHPNVVRYHGCFCEKGPDLTRLVVVQEYLEGETLKERLARMRLGLDVDEGLRIVRAAADGLSYAAGLNIFHRDIKPGNIFLCEDGTVKLIDFGVAKQDGETVDGSSNLRGTFNYMAPDFMSPTFNGDQQSDIFSLGVVLHQIISGRLPYIDGAGADWQGWMSRWRQWSNDMTKADSPIFVHAMTLRLLKGAYEVLEKALEPNRSRRYANFGAFRQDLDKIAFYEQEHDGRTYRRLQFVGKGGFGEVFKARWLEKNVDVAVKQLLNVEYARRFRLEAKVMQDLQDPCFVNFIDFFETSDHAFLVMLFLDGMPGSSLRDAINRFGENGIPKPLVLSAFERYARGLALMHAKKIIHRDIKPANLYFPEGHPDRVAIMDFGIVKAEDSSFTSGMAPCTFDFAPPEIVLTEDRGGPGMDIFALGLCMYEALTGRLAYARIPTGTAGMMAFFERCKSLTPPNFDHPLVVGDPELLALLRKMTAPELSKRYQDAGEVALEIRKLFYRRKEEDDCPPTVVFGPETDHTKPIDETRLMQWYQEWAKGHPVDELRLIEWYKKWVEAHPNPDSKSALPPVPKPSTPSGRWKRLALTGLVSACVSAGGMFLLYQLERHRAPPASAPKPAAPVPVPSAPASTPAKPVSTPAPPPTPAPQQPPRPPEPDPKVVELERQIFEQKRQLFERDFAVAVADEPVETRRRRIADARKMLDRALKEGLYADAAHRDAFEARLAATATAVVGKIKNACECDLTVDDMQLSVGEVRLVRLADGSCSNHVMRIFGHDERAVPADLDGKTIEVKRRDFVISDVEVTLPKLDDGVQCFFAGRKVEGGLSLKPGTYRCEYRRRGYESQQVPFAVELGKGRAFPVPGTWMPAWVDVSLPELEAGVETLFDGKAVAAAFKLRPGQYRVAYLRHGYERQMRDFVVEPATPLTLPPPAAWEAAPVKVMVPALPPDVVCRIDGSDCSSATELLPGRHVSEFVRNGFAVVSNAFDVALATPQTLSAPKPGEWRALPVAVALPKLPRDVTLFVDGKRQPADVATLTLLPGSYRLRFARAKFRDLSSALVVTPGKPAAIVLPDAREWTPAVVERPKPPPKPAELSPEIVRLLADARFYFDDGDYELTVRDFHAAFMKGYRLDANDMNVFDSAYRKRRDYLKSRIEYLEKQEFRKAQNLRDVEEHRAKLRQLGEWYRAVKQT